MKKSNPKNLHHKSISRMRGLLFFCWALLVVCPCAIFAGAPIEEDLAAVYSPSYASSVGGDDNAQVIIANAVAGNNQIQDQGGTGARMRIAGFYRATNDLYNATTTGGVVGWMSSYNANAQEAVDFGASVGADLVVYICQYSDSASIAGVSQQPGMYSALNPGAVWSAVFAHETGGHAYGRSHSDGLLSPKTIMLHNYCGGGAAPPYFYSNPNIWFNGVQLLGDGVNNCSMGSLVNGGDNSSCSAQAVSDRREREVVGPNLSHVVLHWSFTNAPGSAPAGTTISDSVSSAPAVVRGIGATYTGTALRIPGGTTGNVAMNSMSAYIDLPNGIISSRTNITIEIWATPLSVPNWARIMDFGRTVQGGDVNGTSGEWSGLPGTAAPGTTQSSDDIMLSAAIGTDITQQRFEAKLNGTATTLDAGLATTAGVQHCYVITFTDGVGAAGSAGGRWQWYRDGDPVAYLDVTNHLSAIEDVNNWLGRSMWSGDSNARNDYAEVRISDVAMSRGEILANYLLGPNYNSTATVMLTNNDATGATSFNAAGGWSSGAAPSSGNSYETFDYRLRTPATSGSYTFGGDSLKLSGGSLLWKGTASGSVMVNNLVLNNGAVLNSGSGTCTLAGSFSATTNGGILNAVNGAFNIIGTLSGSGPLTFLANTATLGGNNSAFTGKISVGDGMPGVIAINSQARLGAGPSAYVADQLDLNRGTVQTTATMSLDDPNRGIMLDVSGGTFNVASGTTLTLVSRLSSPATASSIVEGSLTKAGGGALVLNSTGTAFKGTLYVDTASTSGNDGVVTVANNQVLAGAHSPIFIRNNNSGSSALQLDGSAGGITLPQAISLSGRSTSVAPVQNVAGTNTISGGISINVGGGNYWIQSTAGLLNLGGTISSAASGTRTFTFLGNGDLNVSGAVADGSATVNVSKQGSGTLTFSGANTYSGTTTVSAGTLRVDGSITASTVTVANNATLGGKGTIAGPVTLQAGTTLSPGNASLGTLTINSSLALNGAGTSLFRLNKTSAANDVLHVNGTLNYAGKLQVTNVSGALSGGDSFHLFSATAMAGNFSSLAGSPGAGLDWKFNSTNGVLTVYSTVPTNITAAVANNVLQITWPADHVGWTLQVQTNNLDAGLGTNWVSVPGSDAATQFSVLLDAENNSVFYRLIYQ